MQAHTKKLANEFQLQFKEVAGQTRHTVNPRGASTLETPQGQEEQEEQEEKKKKLLWVAFLPCVQT